MKEYILPNGLKVLIEKKSSPSVAILINVNVGSNNETPANYGITHFIEHLMFEGTLKRPNSMLISNEIEKIGGELNAATSNERTFYFAKVPKKDFKTALDVLSDITQNSLFTKESIEKERKIILDEINMVTDDPKFHQWVLFQKALYRNHPAKSPVYGSKESVKRITEEQIREYYDNHYRPNNMIITIVGGVNGVISDVKNAFKDFHKKPLIKTRTINEPKEKRAKTVKEIKNTLQSYMVLGYKTMPRLQKDSYVLDVIKGHLGRGQSGRLFQEIRVKHGLAYDVGIMHDPNADYGFFSAYIGTHKKNLQKCKNIILSEFNKLQDMTIGELYDAKKFIQGEYILDNEENFRFADTLAFFTMASKPRKAFDYIKDIESVSLEDVKRVAAKYLTKTCTVAVIEQK